MFPVFKYDNCEVEINGKSIYVELEYSWDYDEEEPDFAYGSEEEDAKELARFESGELSNLVLKVTAKALGETGDDMLGQVFVRSDYATEDLLSTAKEHDMVDRAVSLLKANIIGTYNTLKNALEA